MAVGWRNLTSVLVLEGYQYAIPPKTGCGNDNETEVPGTKE